MALIKSSEMIFIRSIQVLLLYREPFLSLFTFENEKSNFNYENIFKSFFVYDINRLFANITLVLCINKERLDRARFNFNERINKKRFSCYYSLMYNDDKYFHFSSDDNMVHY